MASNQLVSLFGIAILLVLGVFADELSDKNKRFPRLLALLGIGSFLVVSQNFINFNFYSEAISNLHSVDNVRFITELVLSIVLFKEGIELDFRGFLKDIRVILLLAFIGTLISTLIFAVSISVFLSYPFILAIIVAGILTPTDPAATFSLFKGGLKVNPKLKNIIGGESALNDAVAIVLVTEWFLSSLVKGSKSLTFDSNLISEVLISFLGAILLGLALAYFFLFINKNIKLSIQTNLLSLALLITSFIFPLFFHEFHLPVSAAITSLTAGIVFGNPTVFGFNRFPLHELEDFQHVLSETGELIAFSAIGMFIAYNDFALVLGLALLFTLLGLIARLITVNVLLFPYKEISPKKAFFVGWAGMRGLASGTLVLIIYSTLKQYPSVANSLPVSPEILVSAIVLSLLLSALTQSLPMKKIGLRTGSLSKTNLVLKLQIEEEVLTAKLNYLQDVRNKREISLKEYQLLTLPLNDQLQKVRAELELESQNLQTQIKTTTYELLMIHLIEKSTHENEETLELEEILEELTEEEIELTNELEILLNKLSQEFKNLRMGVSRKNEIKTLNEFLEKTLQGIEDGSPRLQALLKIVNNIKDEHFTEKDLQEADLK